MHEKPDNTSEFDAAKEGDVSDARPEQAERPCEADTLPPTVVTRLASHEELVAVPRPACDISDAASSQPRSIKYFGDYEIISEIARGGMGVVYKARQSKLNRIVAVKMILSGVFAFKDDITRFYAEAQAAATLDHPGIVPVFEIGQHEGQHYFAMGYVAGQSLAEKVSKGPLPPREAAELSRKVAEAIAYAHGKGVIHRDLKPANVLMNADGEPKVTDFGLARKLEQDSGLTRTGTVMGTPSYMPPEQAAGKTRQVGPLSDVYSLGAILYCLLTGRPPFQAANPLDTMLQVMEREPVLVQSLNSGVPRDLETICHKCLQKDPAKRYGSAQEFADDLGRWLEGEPIRARAVSTAERAWRWVKRNRTVSGLLAATLAAILIGSAASLWFGIAAKTSESKARQSEAKAKQSEANAIRTLARSDYFLAIARWDENRVLEAKEFLGRVPKEHRNIEWGLAARDFEGSQVTLKGHAEEVTCVSFSPDGTRIASGSAGKTIKLWDATTGEEIQTFKGRESYVTCMSFSPDGTRIASGSASKTIKLWDATTGAELRTLKGHEGWVASVSYSPDGTRIASGSYDNTIKIWDAVTGAEIRTLKGHEREVLSVSFSPDSRRIVSGSCDTTIKLWDAATGSELRTLKGHEHFVASVSFSPDGTRIASGSYDKTIRLWDAVTGSELRTLKGHEREVLSVSFSPDSRRIVSGSFDKTIRLWDAVTGAGLQTLKGHQNGVSCVSFSPEGTRIASGSGDTTVKLWDAAMGAEPRTLKGHEDAVSSVSFSPDGTRIASGSRDKTIRLWDAVTGAGLRTFKGHEHFVSSVSFSPDGTRIVSGSWDNTIKLWDSATGSELRTLKGHRNEVLSVLFSPDGRRIASGSSDKTVKLWNSATGEELRTLMGHEEKVTSVSFSPDGAQIASGSFDKTIRLWDSATGAELRKFKWRESYVASVSFSPDGTWIASAGWDNTIKLWDSATGEELRTLKGHEREVLSVSFSPDSRRVASSSCDHTTKLWDSATGEELRTLKVHQDGDASVSFSPDGRRIASGSLDGTIKLWDSVFYQRDEQAFRRRFAAPKPRWHREQAEALESVGNPYAALFHRAWLLKINPADPQLYDELHETHRKLTAGAATDSLSLPVIVQEMLKLPRPAESPPQ